MSNWILDPTTLPGFRRLHRQPIQKTVTQGIDSGKEARVQKWLTQRWRYEPEFEVLRSSSSFLELQKLVSFFTRHAGKRDNFLLLDPEDNTVTDHGFGVGDGAATTFQLQRTLGAGTLTQDALGSWDTYTKPRTNLLLQSQAFDNASWSKRGTAAVSANQAIAPDGTLTADSVSGIGAVGVNDLFQNHAAQAAGATLAGSVWIKRISTNGTLQIARTYDSAQYITVDLAAIGTGWVRVSGSSVANGSGVFGMQFYATAGAPLSFYLWGAQVELGSTATQYIATTTATVRDDPAYWPLSADGFEPVTEPTWTGVTILKDGVAQAVPSAWSPGAGGQVVFASAPATGAALSWTGSFWRRVRIDDDEPRFEQIMPGRFRGPFEMVSVI